MSKRYVLPSGREVDLTPFAPGLNLAEHIRFHPMQALCGSCGGIGCEYCEPEPEPEPPSFWKRLWRRG